MNNLPGLNYDSNLSVDDLKFAQSSFANAVLTATKIVFGSESMSTPRFGIIDVINPRNIVESEVTRPLAVYNSSNNVLQYNVAPGTATCASGATVTNPSLLEDLALARTNADDLLVVFIENQIIDAHPIRLTRYNTAQAVRLEQATDVIKSALLSDYINPVLFPPSRLLNVVVLAIVKVVSTVSGLELQMDYTASSYSFNRPWYSPVDVEHRSKIGSGAVTDTNPHGTTFNDLSSGSLTIYDQTLPTGVVLAQDQATKGIPGTICLETVTVSRILTDAGGSATSGSRFGGVGAKYIVLSKFPVRITAFYLSSHKGRAIAWDLIPGTRTVVLPSPEVFTSTAIMQYNAVQALEPPATIISSLLSFGQPNQASEIVVSGGISLSELANPTIDFDGSGPVPRDYIVFVKPDGTLLRTPEPIQVPIVLEDIGSVLYPITASFFGPSRLTIGLADANSVPTMSITIRLYGKDANSATIQEDIIFSGTTWVDVSLPGVDTSAQYIKTVNTFSVLSEIQAIARTDDGPSSKIQIWAELETESTPALNRLARVARVGWDGLAISYVKDARQIIRSMPDIPNRFQAAAEMLGQGGAEPVLVASEDFAKPIWKDGTTGYQDATQATFGITVVDGDLIQTGDQIVFPNGKTLTAVTSGSPIRATGQYFTYSSESDTRDDIILTINDVTFASGVVATQGSLPNIVSCIVTQLGARGNGLVTEPTQADPAAITTTNAVGGIDAFGESVMPRHDDFVNSVIPGPSTYDVYNIRNRYLSQPIPIDSATEVQIRLHGVPVPRTQVQVRLRIAVGADTAWLPWEVLAGVGTLFSRSSATAINKAQVELFGYFSGFSLYEVV